MVELSFTTTINGRVHARRTSGNNQLWLSADVEVFVKILPKEKKQRKISPGLVERWPSSATATFTDKVYFDRRDRIVSNSKTRAPTVSFPRVRWLAS